MNKEARNVRRLCGGFADAVPGSMRECMHVRWPQRFLHVLGWLFAVLVRRNCDTQRVNRLTLRHGTPRNPGADSGRCIGEGFRWGNGGHRGRVAHWGEVRSWPAVLCF